MRQKDIFIQDNASSCGACSIASIISFYNGYVPLEVILEDTNTDITGTNAYNLVEALKKYGFNSYGIKADIKTIRASILPAIAHTIEDGCEHFLVIYKVDNSRVLVMDPAKGKVTLTIDDFKTIYTGTLLLAIKERALPEYTSSKSIFKLISPLIKKKKILISIILLIYGLVFSIELLLSFHLKLMGEGLNPIRLMTIFLFLEVFSKFIEYFRTVLLEDIKNSVDIVSLKDFTAHIFHLPRRTLSSRPVGEIMHKIEDMTFIKDLFIKVALIVPLNIITIVSTIIIMYIISPKITLIYLIIIILYFIVSLITKKIVYKEEQKAIKLDNDYTGSLVEYLTGIESIKNLNKEEVFLNKLSCVLETNISARTSRNKKYTRIYLLKSSLFGIGTILINYFSFTALSATFTFYDLITINSLFSLFFNAFESLMEVVLDFTKGKAIFRSICEFYDLKTETLTPTYNKPLDTLKIENLSYSYNKIDKTLLNFSYKLKHGDKVLIKGSSGIGKSTLVKCISRLLTDYEGSIYINDCNTFDMSIKSLKNYVTYIGQEEHLFTASIKDNVVLDSEVENLDYIYKMTLLDRVIAKKRNRDDTMLLSDGINLSGGERSRVILARALAKNPQVLIIDETLSTLGNDDENTILKNLLSMKNISLIYITHRNKDAMFQKIIEFRKDGTYETYSK